MFQLHSRSRSSPEMLNDFVRPSQSGRSGQPAAVQEEESVDEEKQTQSKIVMTDDHDAIRDFDFDSPVSEPEPASSDFCRGYQSKTALFLWACCSIVDDY